jgi:hypothetical protein
MQVAAFDQERTGYLQFRQIVSLRFSASSS